LKDYYCFEAAMEGCQQAGWRGDVPFFFFLISSGHEKECEREKVLLYPQAIHARPVIFFVFWPSALYKYGKGGERLFDLFLPFSSSCC
jgi:hypothetical protein